MFVPASRWMLPTLTLAFAHALPAQDAKLQVVYPPPFCIVQRQSPTEGVLRVRGTYPKTATPGKPVLRDAANGLPVRMIFDAPLQ